MASSGGKAFTMYIIATVSADEEEYWVFHIEMTWTAAKMSGNQEGQTIDKAGQINKNQIIPL